MVRCFLFLSVLSSQYNLNYYEGTIPALKCRNSTFCFKKFEKRFERMPDTNENYLDFTNRAWESLYSAVDNEYFQNEDAQIIYNTLQNHLKPVSFGDYLKRYIYQKAELQGPYTDIPLAEYQEIIVCSFKDNHTPPSFGPTTAKLSALAKNWLSQAGVKRKVVFLLGFGLRMGVSDVNEFLTKGIREPEINPKDPFEAICWYCYRFGFSYLKFDQLWDTYMELPSNPVVIALSNGESTLLARNNMFSIADDKSLLAYLAELKATDNISRLSRTAKKQFDQLYDKARDLVSQLYTHGDMLSTKEKNRSYVSDDINNGDIEKILFAAVPKTKHGNLLKNKDSSLSEQFSGKRLSRQRIRAILSGHSAVNRFDLITLNFFIFSLKLEQFPIAQRRYAQFLLSTNEILRKCFMDQLYIQNPYESFILMCILSEDPLGTYADVWELSYEG